MYLCNGTYLVALLENAGISLYDHVHVIVVTEIKDTFYEIGLNVFFLYIGLHTKSQSRAHEKNYYGF